jgi:hypothetical protein
MNNPAPYDIVVSLTGHDGGAFYMVAGQEGGRLLLCNGRNRKLDNPKRKSPKHVRTVCCGRKAPATDKEIRQTLALAASEAVTKEDTHLG